MLNIDELIKESMKARDKSSLRAYQNLKTEIQKFKTAKNAKPYDEAAELGIISKYCKSLEDAIEQFSEAHRDDLVAEYSNELEVLRKLLPEPVNASQVSSAIKMMGYLKMIDTGISTKDGPIFEPRIEIPKSEMGTVIKSLKSKFPTADGKMISEIVKKYLV